MPPSCRHCAMRTACAPSATRSTRRRTDSLHACATRRRSRRSAASEDADGELARRLVVFFCTQFALTRGDLEKDWPAKFMRWQVKQGACVFKHSLRIRGTLGLITDKRTEICRRGVEDCLKLVPGQASEEILVQTLAVVDKRALESINVVAVGPNV
eukprot:853404-Prymnesium_polylepis.1